MLGKITQLKWTSGGGGNRDLAFIIVILGFGVILVVKLAPYYRAEKQSIAFNNVRTTSSIPKAILEQITPPFVGSRKYEATEMRRPISATAPLDPNRPSVIERPLFDGQAVVLRVRSLNAYSSSDSNQPLEVRVLGPVAANSTEVDLTLAIGAKLVGTVSPNLSAKRLSISFNELISTEGRSYVIKGHAVSSLDLAPGIMGEYSSGLPSRLLGIAADRTIMAVDQIGTAYLFNTLGPTGTGAQELKIAAMETNQQAATNISAEATKDLRETPAEISLPQGTPFLVRVRASSQGVRQ